MFEGVFEESCTSSATMDLSRSAVFSAGDTGLGQATAAERLVIGHEYMPLADLSG